MRWALGSAQRKTEWSRRAAATATLPRGSLISQDLLGLEVSPVMRNTWIPSSRKLMVPSKIPVWKEVRLKTAVTQTLLLGCLTQTTRESQGSGVLPRRPQHIVVEESSGPKAVQGWPRPRPERRSILRLLGPYSYCVPEAWRSWASKTDYWCRTSGTLQRLWRHEPNKVLEWKYC